MIDNEMLMAISDVMDKKLQTHSESMDDKILSAKNDLRDELLLSCSEMMDAKIQPLKNDIRAIKVDLLEHKVLPRLMSIEQHYVTTADRYIESVDKTEAMEVDIAILKKAVKGHSMRLQHT